VLVLGDFCLRLPFFRFFFPSPTVVSVLVLLPLSCLLFRRCCCRRPPFSLSASLVAVLRGDDFKQATVGTDWKGTGGETGAGGGGGGEFGGDGKRDDACCCCCWLRLPPGFTGTVPVYVLAALF